MRQLTERQLAEWHAYYRVEPFGAIRDDYHAAGAAWLLAAINRDPKKQKKPTPIQEFLMFPEPGEHETPPPQPPEQMQSVAERIHQAIQAQQKPKTM